ncbi:hypothetical protein K227x_41760 [Rubripirellula lacrimiformis]|uniref:Uncharacterized protein n=1 Tax=Rubripirellula lacrimiformis TaxID=1930273 RepID=A0A517NF60_9BACT|nr:hypothetical protein K227x_41760 [Rubripirellula lacrimiformis]
MRPGVSGRLAMQVQTWSISRGCDTKRIRTGGIRVCHFSNAELLFSVGAAASVRWEQFTGKRGQGEIRHRFVD